MTGLLAAAVSGPRWLTWAQDAWTAGDATTQQAVWLTVAIYCWALAIVCLVVYLVVAEHPDTDAFLIVLAGAVSGACWPLALAVALTAAAGCALVLPPRAAVQRRRHRQHDRADAAERRDEYLARLEADTLEELDIAALEGSIDGGEV